MCGREVSDKQDKLGPKKGIHTLSHSQQSDRVDVKGCGSVGLWARDSGEHRMSKPMDPTRAHPTCLQPGWTWWILNKVYWITQLKSVITGTVAHTHSH
jgi:hypothetical protein